MKIKTIILLCFIDVFTSKNEFPNGKAYLFHNRYWF